MSNDVRSTVNRVVDAMVKDHGHAYAAGFLNTFLIRVIEESVKEDLEKSMILIRLLSDGICSRIDYITDKVESAR